MSKTFGTIYAVHIDNSGGYDLRVFATQEEEKAFCADLIKESGIQKAIDLLESDPGEAWSVMAEREAADSQHYYARHEVEIPVPKEFADIAGEFFDAVQGLLIKADPRWQSTTSDEDLAAWNNFAEAFLGQNHPTIQSAQGQQNASQGNLARKVFRQTPKLPPYPLNEPSQAKRAEICGRALRKRKG